jgi:two-component system, NtrC family, sensor histidine kinase HydH
MCPSDEAMGSVLVVDDDFVLCELVATILEREGYQPLVCTNPFETMQISEKGRVELAFVDINLPGIDGLELAAVLKQHNPACEIVIMTGYGTFDNAVQAIKVGVHDYLTKPFSGAQITFCLNRFQERRAYKEQIRITEQRYFDLVQNLPLVIFVLRKDFQLDFINQSCHEMFGYTPEEAMSHSEWLLDRIHPKGRESLSRLFQMALNSGKQLLSVETRFVHKRGHTIHGLVTSVPSSESHPDRLEGLIVNITDRVLMEKALVQKEKLKTLGAISAELAHEIRNPLTSIGGFARRMQRSFPNSLEAGIILTECCRLERLVNKIRDYVSPVDLQYKEFSVNDLVARCLDLLSLEMEKKQLKCHLSQGPNIKNILVDSDILLQVFINLVRNAVSAMQKGDCLDVAIFESAQNIHIEFKNPSSEAIAMDQESLFLPFDEGGRSLGLPLCYRLVKSMGGVLSFVQEKSNVTFTVSIPRHQMSSDLAQNEEDATRQ